ncbi:linear amide C-N hydrolase [Francisella frigiditurris]|uniref:Linear amide C-N hydrolase, choloylglycine hydrolase family protein n=1 Tax=Francisella frigiditurris TaxID=1542390 RepID=A0A1J0KS23_9GAMM|nr:linear amide C-N hydrolase [Francisella frigiditurris]APC96454.1 linear amide C-N hydrolase, choloylglycine hydrolase family protein [Francisella frigiditurris]
MKKVLKAGLLLSSVLVSSAIACTAITIKGNDGDVVAGRTMEWGFDWDWSLTYMPAGTTHTLTAPKDLDLPKENYSSKYSVLGTGIAISKDDFFIADGQNSEGLSLSANYLPGFTQYQEVEKTDKNYASILEITTYILSQYDNVDDVKKGLEKYKVWNDSSTDVNGVVPEVHFLISDKNGNAMVVEYVKGEVHFYNPELDVKVMTNSPTYDWHLINLRNYLNLSNKTVSNIKLYDENGLIPQGAKYKTIDGLGQGNGLLGLPGDYSPSSRFIRTAVLGYYSDNENIEGESTLNKVAHVLHNADILKGVVAEEVDGKTYYDHTAFTAIKDLTNNTLYVNVYDNPLNSVSIDLNSLDKQHAKEFTKNIKDLPYPKSDITSSLV